MNKPVSFELAELLKEKGFDENCRYGYNGSFKPHHTGLIEFGYLQTNSELLELTYSAPTIADVVMWLYEKHGVWIEVHHIRISGTDKFHIIIWDCKDNSDYFTIYHDEIGPGFRVWYTPAEAYEAAIEYCLTKLI